MLKLLLSGHALACLKRLRQEGLHHGVLPLLDVVLEQPHGEKFITLALTNTDERVRAGKPVSPGFLFATLLWHDMQTRWQQFDGGRRISGARAASRDGRRARHADREARDPQALLVGYARDLGPAARLEKRSGRSALKLLEHQRFRAGYDFLLLRCESGELDASVGQWWTDFIEGDAAAREALLTQGGKDRAPKKRRRRSSNAKSRKTGDGMEGGTPRSEGASEARHVTCVSTR